MASFCLYDTLNALAPCDTGGFWQYISGPSSIMYSPTCGNPCPAPIMKVAGDVLGCNTGCLTCTGCVVNTSNPCVTLTDGSGTYTFRYSTKCIGDCCEPEPDCTADLVFEPSAPGLTISDMATTCTYTASLSYSSILQPSSEYITSRMTVTVTSPCGPLSQSVDVDDTLSGRTANGYDLQFTVDGCELCRIEKFKCSIRKTNGTIVHSPYLNIADYPGVSGSCGDYNCNWFGSNQSLVKDYYKCAYEFLIKQWADTQGDGVWTAGTHFEVYTAMSSSGLLTIRMLNKQMAGSSNKWAGFDKNTDNVSWRQNNPMACTYNQTTSVTTFDHVDDNDTGNTADFNQAIGFAGSCFNGGIGNTVTGRFKNVTNLTSTNFNVIVPNASASWIVVTAPAITGFTGSGPYTLSCASNDLTAHVTGCTPVSYTWKDAGGTTIGTMPTLSWAHNLSGSTECIQLKVVCDTGCTTCSHICLTNSPPYYSGSYTGNCSTGCSNNTSC